MTWNYRVIETKHSEEDSTYDICEVYYDKDGNIIAISGPQTLTSVDNDYKSGLIWIMDKMKDALGKPVIQHNYFEVK
jgi:hypothetical protein